MYRVVVNALCSQGAAGFTTHLPTSFTVGTGFAGWSSIAENLDPQHLVHSTKIAYGKIVPADVGKIDFGGMPESNSSIHTMPSRPVSASYELQIDRA